MRLLKPQPRHRHRALACSLTGARGQNAQGMAGLQHRTRKVLVQPTAGKACLSRWEYQTCNDKPCPPVTQQLDDGAAAQRWCAVSGIRKRSARYCC